MIGCVILWKSNNYNFCVQALPHAQVATIADGHHLSDEVKAKVRLRRNETTQPLVGKWLPG